MAKQPSWLMTYAPTDTLPGQQGLNLTCCDPWGTKRRICDQATNTLDCPTTGCTKVGIVVF